METAIRVTEVPASRGATWIAQAFVLFRRAPLAWIALCAGWLLAWLALVSIPVVGPVAANVLQPVFFAAFAVAALRQTREESMAVKDLFTGFAPKLRPLMNLGILMSIAQVAIAALMSFMGMPRWPADREFDLMEYAEMLRANQLVLWVGFALMGITSGAVWFAPQLIAFHGMSLTHAMRWSVYAALSNLGAMLLYGVVLLGLLLLGPLTLGLALFFAVPLLAISTYTSYREVFATGSPSPPDGSPAAG